MNTKKFAIILVLAILIAAGLFFYLKKSQDSRFEKKTTQTAKVEKTNVDFSKTPERFPTNVPIENGARLTQNYNATSPGGNFQATRTFETTKALDFNLNLYTEFLKSDGWTVKATVNNPTYKMVMGTKGEQSLQVSIDENKSNKIKTVSITYTEPK